MRNRFATCVTAALALAILAAPLAADGQTHRYHVVQLPEVPSPSFCVPTAINDTGDVVGYCDAGESNPFAVLWRDGTVEDLRTWSSGTFTHAWAINSLGQVVGDGDDGDGTPKALVRRGSGWFQIDDSGGSAQQAYGITDGGVIFGNYTTQGGSIGTIDWDPVFWTYDAEHDRYDRHDLARPTGTMSGAFIFAVSRDGSAVGDGASDVIGNQAVLWNNDDLHSIEVLPSPAGFGSTRALGISDDLRVAGAAFDAAGSRAVLWQNDRTHTPLDLGLLPGDVRSEAYGVNTAGQVVGVSIDAAFVGRGFLYENNTISELTTLIDPADGAWTIGAPAGINNAGEIIAVGLLDGRLVPVKLVPSLPSVVTAVTVAADRTAPQMLGTTVTFTASAAGGVAPIQFKWLVYDGVSSTVASDWSAAATFTWTPTAANASYTVTAWARSAGSGEDGPEKSAELAFAILPNPLSGIVSLTVDRKAPQKPETTMTFKASWVGAPAPLEFKWLVSDGSSSKVMQDWSATSTFAWTPTAADKYTVSVWARRAGNGKDAAEKSAAMAFTIKGKAATVRK
jgi:probable HAF family extracellular repeat protein